MEENQEILFAKTLEKVKRLAREQGNSIRKEQVEEAFQVLALSKEQLAMVFEYLEKYHITIGESAAEEEDILSEEEIDYLESIHIPYVVVDRIPELRNCPAVGTDHEIGGYLAARHLLSLGHRRIACVVGPHATQMDSEARYHGYCRAMEEAGIPVDERLVCAGEYTQEGGAAAVEKLISQDFTAIFACNDASAYGVCRKLKEYRKKVPEDVSVVGYDDVFYARMLEVPLTTIRQQVREMGREAVRLLLKQIREHKRPESKVIFAPELVVRESTARIQPSQ